MGSEVVSNRCALALVLYALVPTIPFFMGQGLGKEEEVCDEARPRRCDGSKGSVANLATLGICIFAEALLGVELSAWLWNDFFVSLLLLVMTHELLHAMSYWYYGCFALPLPLMSPPILGVTFARCGAKSRIPKIAPLAISVVGFAIGLATGSYRYQFLALLNLAGSAYDVATFFLHR